VVFSKEKVAVFADGEFWHGYRFPSWRRKMSPWRQEKIESNRARDRRNFAKLRRVGWKVIRIWGRDVERDPAACAGRVIGAVKRRR